MGGFRKEAVDTLVANIVALWALLDDDFKSSVGCKYREGEMVITDHDAQIQQVGHVRYENIGPIEYQITKYVTTSHRVAKTIINGKCGCHTRFTVKRYLRGKPNHYQSAEITYLPLPYTIEDCTTDRTVGNLLIRAWNPHMVPGWNF